ncbi:MAG: nucleoside recognition protein [Lachnospiraceae bacterium]
MPKIRIVPIILLGLLLLFPAYSIQGASSGILLWFQVVLPTLAPFIICTQMVVALDGVDLLVRPFRRLFGTCFGLSDNGTYVLICGLLCGYPLGAKLCGDFLDYGKISRQEADYLLSMCNHPSPMFLLGFVMSQLPQALPPAYLLACLYLPIIPVSLLSRRFYFRFGNKPGLQPTTMSICSIAADGSDDSTRRLSLEEILLSTCETMVVIGGYIMLFSILAVWIQQITLLTPQAKALLTGIAEITTGVNQICRTLPANQAIPMVIAVVAFGGLSGIFQTRSVIKNAGLSIRHYISWKTIHTCFSCIIFILLSLLPPQ